MVNNVGKLHNGRFNHVIKDKKVGKLLDGWFNYVITLHVILELCFFFFFFFLAKGISVMTT